MPEVVDASSMAVEAQHLEGKSFVVDFGCLNLQTSAGIAVVAKDVQVLGFEGIQRVVGKLHKAIAYASRDAEEPNTGNCSAVGGICNETSLDRAHKDSHQLVLQRNIYYTEIRNSYLLSKVASCAHAYLRPFF